MAQDTPAGATTRTWQTGIVLGLVGWGLGFALGQLGVSKHLDVLIYDAAMQSAAPLPHDERVARVYIGDTDLEVFGESQGRWPWRSRMLHKEVLDLFRDVGAAAVAYDIFFTEPSQPGADGVDSDQEFAYAVVYFEEPDEGRFGVVHGCLFQTQAGDRWGEASLSQLGSETLRAAGASYGVAAPGTEVVEGRAPALPIDPLLEASPLMGHCNPLVDHDRSIRRVPLFLRYEDRLHPSLALRVAMLAMNVSPDDVVFDPESREVRMIRSDGTELRVPVDPDGGLWVHYDRPLAETIGYQYSELHHAEVREALAGSVVVVGVSITGSSDLWRTPMAEAYPGYLIHAQVLENILTGRFVTALQPDRYPFGGRELALHVLLLLLCAGLGAVTSRIAATWAWTVTFAAAAAAPVLAWVLLTQADVWLTPTTGTASLAVAGFLGVGYHQVLEARERRRTRRVYERYLSPAVLDAVLNDPELLQLGGARKELSIFFADIRGFTEFAETIEPEELTERLNEYYGEMIAIAHRYEATVDKLIGDSLMVFFGNPVVQPDHALRAVRMALAMQKRLAELGEAWKNRGVHPFSAGMGVATGYVAVGNLGSDGFVDYTVVGRAVNTAARLEGSAAPGEILIDERAYQGVREEIDAERLGTRELKGIAKPVTIYRVSQPEA